MNNPTLSTAPSLVASRNPVICIVDDDDVYRQYLAAILKANNCQVLEASRGQELMDLLATHRIDCILLDYSLAAENGLSVHEQIKDRFRELPPVVMLTGEAGGRTIIKAFRGGFTDYLLKRDLRPDELFRVVCNALCRKDIEKSEQEELARLRQKSDFDDATGLYTHEYIKKQVARIAGLRRQGRFAIILINFTELDGIGDKFGQVIQDRMFRVLAARLRAIVRASDICGRYEDAKFLYLVDVDVRYKSISAICVRIVEELSLEINFDGLSLKVAPAIGAAIYPFDGDTVEVVLASAERALDECKASAAPFVVASAPRATGGEPCVDWAKSGCEAGRSTESTGIGVPIATEINEPEVDRRAARRTRILKRGQIFIPTIPSAIECTIRDISSKGARLRVGAAFMAPEQFDVVLGTTTERRRAVLRWQVGNELGVQFVDVDHGRDQPA
jgi:diguanylate cyclase (GGDEF)-like protein